MQTVGGVVTTDLEMEFDFNVDDIDFGDFFLRLEDGDALPDLEVDPAEILTDFEALATGVDRRDQEVPCPELSAVVEDVGSVSPSGGVIDVEGMEFAGAGTGEEKGDCNHAVVDGRGDIGGDRAVVADTKSPLSTTSSSHEAESRHKLSSSKDSPGKKKAKVDWTPELHRRFVQAVEQLGIDKAVPSRILEMMGINSLTRHNIASHLQYRSHRKHMLAREAEAVSWTKRRQMYAAGGHAVVKRQDSNGWTVPTIGFPPPPPPPPPPAMQHYVRPLHVWGHPTMDSPRMAMWPRHLVPSAPTQSWAPPSSDRSFWHHPYMRGPAHMPNHGTPCMAIQMPPAKFPAPPVLGVMPCPVYRPLSPPALASKNQHDAQLQRQAQLSNETIDEAIGDVLSKPWLPLPLGLKPPSLGSVMGELERQGVVDVPQACG